MSTAAAPTAIGELDEYRSCRRCRARLAAPTSNERSAFCSKGCHRYWYARHCMACEGPTTARHGRECRLELAAIKRHGMMGKFHQKSRHLTKVAQRDESLSQTPISIGFAKGQNPVVAGPEVVDFNRCLQCAGSFPYVKERFCSTDCRGVYNTGVRVVAGDAGSLDLRLASLDWPESERQPIHPGMARSQYEAAQRDLQGAHPDWSAAQITEHITSILKPQNRISTTGLARKCNARLDGHPRPTTCSGTIPHADYKASRAFPNLMSTETQNVVQKEF
jgi:hypothetical protein